MDGQTDGWTITMNAAGPYLSADFDLDTAHSFLWVKNAACIHFKVLKQNFFCIRKLLSIGQDGETNGTDTHTGRQAYRQINRPGNTKGGSITVTLTFCLTGLESAVRQFLFLFAKQTNPNQ
jgi:hypothetical protein